MSSNPQRTFGLLDAMILVAATAVGAMSLRLFQAYGLELVPIYHDMFPGLFAPEYPGITVRLAGPWLATFSVALVVIRLRGSRPALVRLTRRPGTTACLAAVAVIVPAAVLAAAASALTGTPAADTVHYKLLPPITEISAAAVAAVWLVQALSRRWRPEPSWIDRAGRCVGAGWIIVFLIGTWDVFWLAAIEDRSRPPALSAAAEAAAAKERAVVDNIMKKLEAEAPAPEAEITERDADVPKP